MRPYYLVLLAMFLLFACAREKQQEIAKSTSETSAPVIEIQPFEATKETTFYISSKGIDFSKAQVQWYINGIPVEGGSASQYRPSEIKKSDKVQAKVLINNQEVASNQITIKNIPPTIVQAKIVPSVPKGDTILKIDVISNDRDGDEVSLRYEWSKNGEPAGSGESLEGPFKRGDRISVKITPFDGEDYGQPIILTSNIYNSPPRPLTGNIEKFENNVYSYQINATDPDGDTLTYTLKHAPKGMVIDKTGLITWKVSEKDTGRHPVTVQITDGHGGEVLYNLDITIRFE